MDLGIDWWYTGPLLGIAVVFAIVRKVRTGRWGPSKAEQRAHLQEEASPSPRAKVLTVVIAIAAGIAAVAVTGVWWTFFLGVFAFGFRVFLDRLFARRMLRT